MSDMDKLEGESGTPGQQSPPPAKRASHAQLYNGSHCQQCVSRGLRVWTAPGSGTDASVRMLCSSFSHASGALASKGAEAGIFLHKVGVPGDGKKPKQRARICDRNNREREWSEWGPGVTLASGKSPPANFKKNWRTVRLVWHSCSILFIKTHASGI